jgi:DNA repair exonuclease SbcCD ATPase subunit
VEAMISLLFRTGRRSTINWALREWEFAGSITVSGLEKKPIKFVKGIKKIDDYWAQEIGLPQDFSRLLVVKEGETALTDAREGADRDILKNYLSGEGLLDKLEARISATLREANIHNGRIVGSRRGEIKDREQLSEDLQGLDRLLEKAELAYTSGTIYDLRQKKESLEAELKRLEDAKCYRAKCLHEQIETLSKKKQELPIQEELAKIDSQISVYEEKKSQANTKSATLKKLQSLTENFEWAEQALQVYQDITGGKGVIRSKSLWMILTWISLAGAILTGFLRFPIPAALCAVVALGLSLYYFLIMRRALASTGASEELERLRAEFKNRFRAELTDQALLRTKTEELKESFIRAKATEEELRVTLSPELRHLEHDITLDLKRFTGRELPVQEGRETVKGLRKEVNELDNELNTLAKELASLGVPEEEFLAEDSGIAWNTGRYKELQEQFNETSLALKNEEENLGQLKVRIAQETRSDSSDWEELIAALRSLSEQETENYKRLTAEILAKVKLYGVIGELRQEENARIASGLESKELTNSLHAITGRYRGMRYDGEEGLILITNEDEEYLLHEVSTGAREQALLAIRLGFSSMIMKGNCAFLILDDAFQHSDWPRRSNLVNRILSIAESGWQVFYFTMDDHIRTLFLKARDRLGDGFASCELS